MCEHHVGMHQVHAFQVIMAHLGTLMPSKGMPGALSLDWNALQFVHIDCRMVPIDLILMCMGAYDNIFSNVTTFKVELNEMSVSWCPQYHCIQLSFPNCLRDATSSSMILKV